MSFQISVPATLSNLGPGYDVLGMAVSVHNTFFFAEGEGDPDHLSQVTMKQAAAAFGGAAPDVEITQDERIPRSRGLGSSATARVAGLLAWSHYSGVRPPLEDLLAFLADKEGHPDNAVPAMVGGLTLAAHVDGAVQHLCLDPPLQLRVALCVPDLEISTNAARAILPEAVPRADAIFNVSRIAFLLAALLDGRLDMLGMGVEDRLHQPWRKTLIGPVDAAFEAARDAGAAGAFVSGSGSTLAAFVTRPDVDVLEVAKALASPFEVACETLAVRPVAAGAWTS